MLEVRRRLESHEHLTHLGPVLEGVCIERSNLSPRSGWFEIADPVESIHKGVASTPICALAVELHSLTIYGEERRFKIGLRPTLIPPVAS
jgi:hypothetical protein